MTSQTKFAVYQAQNIVVLTGAGISADSGIETFRDADDSLWNKFDPEVLSSMHGFMEDPKLVWDWYKDRRDTFVNAQPNSGHAAIVKLAEKKNVTIITQNIDDLHEKAGSTNVIHLHGEGDKARCTDPDCDWHGAYTDTYPGSMPKCPRCDELARPDVVWFGEMLDARIVERAITAMRNADLAIVIGTSSVVQPAASLPQWVSMKGAEVISINKRREDHNYFASIRLTGSASSILPMIIT